jgi:hypothetical protein
MAPLVGRLQLTVMGVFDGVPGDTIPGNNSYDLPEEWVATGQLSSDKPELGPLSERPFS